MRRALQANGGLQGCHTQGRGKVAVREYPEPNTVSSLAKEQLASRFQVSLHLFVVASDMG